MKSKLLFDAALPGARAEGGETTFALVFQKGDEVMSELTAFARANRLRASRLSGIGAFSDVVLGYFDRNKMDYERIKIDEQVEVLSFIGNVALKDGEPHVHAHVTLGRSDGSGCGGHLFEAHVFPTLELSLTDSPSHLIKRADEETGLALIDPEVGG